jgi:hypothetical protein
LRKKEGRPTSSCQSLIDDERIPQIPARGAHKAFRLASHYQYWELPPSLLTDEEMSSSYSPQSWC